MLKDGKTVLIIGAGGGLARIVCKQLYLLDPSLKIIGVDSRPISVQPDHPNLTLKQIKYRRGEFENLFRTRRIDAVLFLSRVTHSSISTNLIKKRLNLTLQGTETILELCLKHKVERITIMSSFHVYGALNDNSVFLYEDAPLKASLKHADLRDVVEMDQHCHSWMLQHKEKIDTVLLRPTNIIGPSLHNGITKYLVHPMSFYPMDYNPMIQFIHEYDMASVLVKSLHDLTPGLYNITSEEYIPLKEAVKMVNSKAFPLPIFPLARLNSLLNRHVGVPNYLIDYLKYPCLLSNHKFLRVVGNDFFQYTTQSALETLLIRNLQYLSV